MYYILHTLCLLNSNTKLKSWKKGKEKCHCLHFSIIYNHPLLPTHTHCSMSEPHCSNLSRYLWALGHPASYFFFLCDHRILTTHHALGEPPLSAFDYTALHRKGTQWVDIKWLKLAACQSMVMKQASCSSQAVCAFHWGLQETFHQSLNTKLLLKRLRYSGMGLEPGQVDWRQNLATLWDRLLMKLSESLIQLRICHEALYLSC